MNANPEQSWENTEIFGCSLMGERSTTPFLRHVFIRVDSREFAGS
jgi:hypothetical protein